VPGRSYDAPGYPAGLSGPRPYDSPVAAPSLPGGTTAPPTAAPRPYAPPVGDPLGAPRPAGPVGGYAGPHDTTGPQYSTGSPYSTGSLPHRLGSPDPLDQPYRPEYEGPR
jgi:hypothetical protein